MTQPFVSVIIPCFNEENYIGSIIEDILRQDYPRELLEVIIADGMSSDQTVGIIQKYQEQYSFIRLELNRKQYVPFALNLGIEKAVGDVIMIMGSHAEYPANYISVLVDALYELNADNVGGVCLATPRENNAKAKAIASALSSPFGVGNAMFRIGSDKRMKVDTVTFGCYRNSVFDRIGKFDEDLLRNQDDEFNGRLIKFGGSIYLIPEVIIKYFPRSTISATSQMFYQYGLFKPLVAVRLGKPATLRQIVPPLFLLFLLTFLPASFAHYLFRYVFVSVSGLYIFANLIATLTICIGSRSGLQAFYLPWLFFIIHISYGFGYLKGILKFTIKRGEVKGIKSSR